jgi:hypothetical protein
MIIDLCSSSGDLRIRTRSTPAVRHAVDLARAVLALGNDGHLTVRHVSKLPEIEFDDHYTPRGAIEELLRLTTLFETEEGLAGLVRRVRRDAKLPGRQRRRLIEAIAPTLVVGFVCCEGRSAGSPPDGCVGLRD